MTKTKATSPLKHHKLLIGVAMVLILTLSFSTLLLYQSKRARKKELKLELGDLRSRLSNQLDCAGTLATADIFSLEDLEMKCSKGTKPPLLRLVRNASDGGPIHFTGPLRRDGSAKLGSWYFRTSCHKKPYGIKIQYARPHMREIASPFPKIHWKHAPSLFERHESEEICKGFFQAKRAPDMISTETTGGLVSLTVSVPAGSKFNVKTLVVPNGRQFWLSNLSIDPQFNKGTIRCYVSTEESSALLAYLRRYKRGGSILKKLDNPVRIVGPAQLVLLAESVKTDVSSSCYFVGSLRAPESTTF